MSVLHPEQLHYLEACLKEIDYGLIQITIHDGEVMQIDVTEKKRFPKQKKQGEKSTCLITKK